MRLSGEIQHEGLYLSFSISAQEPSLSDFFLRNLPRSKFFHELHCSAQTSSDKVHVVELVN